MIVKHADTLWRECIRRRDGGRCARCRKICRGHAHHIVPRAVTRTRWLLRNGMYLCAQCHDTIHRMEGERNYGMTEELRALATESVPRRIWAERAVVHLQQCLETGVLSEMDDGNAPERPPEAP